MSLVLIPGFMTDADLWRELGPRLHAFGPTLHADLGRDPTIQAMAHRVLDEAPAVFAAIGFSMGGYVAREAARLAPDRVAALALVATSARGDSAIQARRKAAAASQAEGAAPFRGLSRSSLVSSLHPDRAGDEAMIARIQAMGARLGAEAFRRQSLLHREGDLDRLHEIRCPTLIVAGAQDRLRPLEEAEEMHRRIAGSELTVIDGVGHMIPLEAPDRLGDVLAAWLGRIGLGGDQVPA